MIFAKINVRGNQAALTEGKPLTSGTVGARVELTFDEVWEGLDKILVWQSAGGVWTDRECTGIIPPQALARGGEKLLMGICGRDGDRVLPTVWVDLGVILQGAEPEGEPLGEPALPLWAQVLEELEELKTQGGTGGKDGISATHSWDGTVLTVTSASGTSSADLKGDPGQDGISSEVTVGIGWELDGRHNMTVRSTMTLPDGTATVSEGKVVDGKDGNGIKSAVLNDDYTLTLTFDDGTSYTTPSIRGATGATGNAGKDGSNGTNGTDGVGIASIEQTTTSTADGGNNVFTVTLTNGVSETFTVKNGSKGSTGSAGADGTSVTVTSVSESTADGGSNVVTFSDGKTVTIKNGSKGSSGTNGTNGTSVTVSNVSESAASGGTNVVTFSDGKKVNIKNGINGTNGKSAYAYAQDGGFTGTETEFTAALAEEKISKAFMTAVFEDLKAAIAESNIDAAIAVLDKAILDLSALS